MESFVSAVMTFLVIHLSTGEKGCKNPLMYHKLYDFPVLIPVLTMTGPLEHPNLS